MNNTELTKLTLDPRVGTSKVWMPTRAVSDLKTTNLQNDIAVLQNQPRTETAAAPNTSTDTSTPTTPSGTPAHVTGVTATESVTKVNGQMVSLVSISYTAPLADPYFAGVQIWFTGYHGSSTPQLVCQGNQSPVSFTTDTTGETVLVTVVSVGKNGSTADFNTAPPTSVTLNGVTTAPPAPSIAQGVVAIGTGIGWQFAWNVENGLLNDIIAGYWVYSNTTNTPPSVNGRVQYFPQPVSNIGTLTYQELTSDTKYYWVSAVNSSGLESPLTPATTVTVVRGYYPLATYALSTYDNPAQAYDGNETTSASAHVETYPEDTSSTSLMYEIMGVSAPPTSGVTVTDMVLKVMSDVELTNEASASLLYSLDAGTTWTTIYSLSNYAPADEGTGIAPSNTLASRAKQYDNITLPLAQDLSKVYVRANASASTTTVMVYDPHGYNPDYPVTYPATANHNIYECRVDVTYRVTG